MTIRIATLGALLGAALIATPAAAEQVFAWDFETAPTLGTFPVAGYSLTNAGGTVTGAQNLGPPPVGYPAAGFGTTFFQNTTSNLTLLTLTGLGAHSSLTVAFDIAFIDTWDGIAGDDYLYVTADGAPLLTLSSDHWLGGGSQYEGGELVGVGPYYRDLGSDDDYNYPDAVFRYSGLAVLTFAHTAPTFSLGFQAGGTGWQGDANPWDESYGVDNISISAAAVPEPATWGLMLLGFGGLGAVLRSRRRIALA